MTPINSSVCKQKKLEDCDAQSYSNILLSIESLQTLLHSVAQISDQSAILLSQLHWILWNGTNILGDDSNQSLHAYMGMIIFFFIFKEINDAVEPWLFIAMTLQLS